MLAARRVALNPFSDQANVNYLRELVASQGTRIGREALNTMLDNYRKEKQSDLTLVTGMA